MDWTPGASSGTGKKPPKQNKLPPAKQWIRKLPFSLSKSKQTCFDHNFSKSAIQPRGQIFPVTARNVDEACQFWAEKVKIKIKNVQML